jgi:hypothetical protein
VSDEDHFMEYPRFGGVGEAEGSAKVGRGSVSLHLVSPGDKAPDLRCFAQCISLGQFSSRLLLSSFGGGVRRACDDLGFV